MLAARGGVGLRERTRELDRCRQVHGVALKPVNPIHEIARQLWRYEHQLLLIGFFAGLHRKPLGGFGS